MTRGAVNAVPYSASVPIQRRGEGFVDGVDRELERAAADHSTLRRSARCRPERRRRVRSPAAGNTARTRSGAPAAIRTSQGCVERDRSGKNGPGPLPPRAKRRRRDRGRTGQRHDAGPRPAPPADRRQLGDPRRVEIERRMESARMSGTNICAREPGRRSSTALTSASSTPRRMPSTNRATRRSSAAATCARSPAPATNEDRVRRRRDERSRAAARAIERHTREPAPTPRPSPPTERARPA